jgi:bacillithiol system protein YtxJ
MQWIPLQSIEEFQNLLLKDTTLAVFKHSNRCSISTMVKNRVEREWSLDIPVYLVDVLNHRDVSNYISETTSIQHESPQLLCFKNKNLLYNASHNNIIISEIIEKN